MKLSKYGVYEGPVNFSEEKYLHIFTEQLKESNRIVIQYDKKGFIGKTNFTLKCRYCYETKSNNLYIWVSNDERRIFLALGKFYHQ